MIGGNSFGGATFGGNKDAQVTIYVSVERGEIVVSANAPVTNVAREGVPLFNVERSGNTVTITVKNRDSQEVELFRGTRHNKPTSAVKYFTSDSTTDSVSADTDYSYQLRFVGRDSGSNISAEGRKSQRKFVAEN